MDNQQSNKKKFNSELQVLQKEFNSLKAKYQRDIIDVRHIKKDLIIKEERKATLQTAMSGFWRTDLQGHILEVNEAYCKISGYSEQELLTMHVSDLEAIKNEEEEAAHIQKVLSQGRDSFESKRRHKDGNIYEVEANVQLLNIDGGQIVGFLNNITSQKQVEKKLLESEMNYESITKNVPGMIYRFNYDRLAKFITNSELVCGYGSDLFLTGEIKWDELILPEDLEKVFSESETLLQTPISILQEYRIRAKDSSVRHVADFKTSLFDKENNFIGIDGIVIDITDKKNNELELILAKEKAEISEAKYKKISNLTFEGIIIHDNGVVIDLNHTVEKLIKYSREELIGKNIIDIAIPEKYHPVVFENIKSEFPYPYEIECVTKQGSLIPIEVEAKLIKSEIDNKFNRVVAIRDISQRKKNQSKIKKLSLAVEQSANSITITDRNGNIEYINLKFTLLTGYTAKEALGQNLRMLSSGAHSQKFYSVLWKTITSGKVWKSEFYNKKKNGEYYWVFETITPLKNEHGEITNFLAIKEDVTALKVQREKLQLQNKELIIAKEKAEESEKLKSAFLANMSHEIRTPMNGILGFTELLLKPDLKSNDKSKFIKLIHKSGQRMLNTVSDIIELSKIESGILNVKKTSINANEKLEELVQFFQLEAQRKKINLIIEKLLDENSATIHTDVSKFESILSNLIKNAIKFTDQGSIKVGCYKKQSDIEFYIKDTGIGIPENRLEAIFNRFEQADITDLRAFQGSGLGLTISKSYVDMLGGTIGVESEQGKGSEFKFSIPSK